jgi:TonB family protein
MKVLWVVLATATSVLTLAQPPAPSTQQDNSKDETRVTSQSPPAKQKVYKVGRGVTPPVALETPQPTYQQEAKKAKYQGTVLLWIVIDEEGSVTEVKVVRSIDKNLDRKAVEAVRKWRFKPAMKDGNPVAVEINVEVNFHLY